MKAARSSCSSLQRAFSVHCRQVIRVGNTNSVMTVYPRGMGAPYSLGLRIVFMSCRSAIYEAWERLLHFEGKMPVCICNHRFANFHFTATPLLLQPQKREAWLFFLSFLAICNINFPATKLPPVFCSNIYTCKEETWCQLTPQMNASAGQPR